MKKGFYILLLIVGLVVVSCNKQEITANSNVMLEIPQWDSSNEKSGGSGEIIDDTDGEGEGDDPIVDPNNPEDGNKKP